jgi:ribosomal protein S18 acetylase RimI-like enzyme
MTLALRSLDGWEVDQLLPAIQRGYAADIHASGGLPEEAARLKAAEDVPRVVEDAANELYAIEEDGERVGHLWLGEREQHGRRFLWIWDVFVDERHRGRGLGRQAMLLAEAEARRRGLRRVELNVFAANEVARGLYRSLGYDEVSVWMGKDVA